MASTSQMMMESPNKRDGEQIQIAETLAVFPDGDKDNPRNWPVGRKVLVSLGPLALSFISCFQISIYIGSIPGVMETFNVSKTVAILPLSLAALGFMAGPILAVSISELYGRRIVYFLCLPLAMIFFIVAATSRNISTLLVARFLDSFFIAPCMNVTVGVLNDVWDMQTDKLGLIFALLFGGFQVWATEIGPISSPAIVQDTQNWRWTLWLIAILCGCSFVTLLNPETYVPVLLRRRQIELGLETTPRLKLPKVLSISLGRALYMLFTEPVILSTSLLNATVLACLYCFYVAYPVVFESVYNFTSYQTGLTYIPILVGSFIGMPLLLAFDKLTYQKAKLKAESMGQLVEPEERLWAAITSIVLMPISLFWVGWTAKASIHWIVPVLGGLPLGIALFIVLICIPVYKNDVYGASYGASAYAAERILSYLFAMPFPLFTIQMIERLTFKWTMSLLGFICLVLCPIPAVIYVYGKRLRQKSSYVPVL